MSDSTTTLLCTGDIHMGRQPTRLPSHIDAHRFASTVAWAGIVDEAIERGVQAVVLTGDVVDRENRYYEAIGPLEVGLRRLGEAGIPSFAVAGNHDFDVFPEIVETLDIEGFHLLGSRGKWSRETLILPGEERPRLSLVGWSFTGRYVRDSPLETYIHEESEEPVLGVLHADVDAEPGSHYGPVRSADLSRAGPNLWLLGHIHSPGYHETESGVGYLYPGSPQPLDPGETGAHGPWLVEIDASGEIRANQLPSATVRYENLEVDLEGVDREADVRSSLHARLREVVRSDLDGGGGLEHLVCRLLLRGRTPLHGILREVVSDAEEDLRLDLGGTTLTVDRVYVETSPALELEALAETASPLGALARIVLALDGGEDLDGLRTLLDRADEAVCEVDRSPTYAPVFDHDEGLESVERVDLKALVRQQALLLMDALQRQKEGADR